MTDRGRTVELWIGLLALAALVLYAIGWSFLGRFYGEFGVEPEEVGRSWDWIVARTAVVVVPPLGAVVAGGAAVGGRTTLVAWITRPGDAVEGAARVVVSAMAFTVVGFAGLLLTALLVAGIVSEALLLVLGLFVLGFAVTTNRPGLAIVAAVAAVGGLLLTSRVIAEEDAALVRAGESVSFRPLDVGPTVLEVPQVRVVAPGHVLDGSCVALLGVGADATAVLHAAVPGAPADEVWRLSLGEVDLVRFGNGVCDPIAGYDVDDGWPDDRPSTATP